MNVATLMALLAKCPPLDEVRLAWESGIRQDVDEVLLVNLPDERIVVLTDSDQMRWFENPSFSDPLDWKRAGA